jgi:hypothetical protein
MKSCLRHRSTKETRLKYCTKGHRLSISEGHPIRPGTITISIVAVDCSFASKGYPALHQYLRNPTPERITHKRVCETLLRYCPARPIDRSSNNPQTLSQPPNLPSNNHKSLVNLLTPTSPSTSQTPSSPPPSASSPSPHTESAPAPPPSPIQTDESASGNPLSYTPSPYTGHRT